MAEKAKPVQSTRWAFTMFLETICEINWELWKEKGVTYLIYGFETCPTTGKDHIQGYLECKKKTLGGIKKLGITHAETAKGTAEQNKKYCSKEGKWKEHGIMMNQGKRNDLIEIQQRLQSGERLKTIIDEGSSSAIVHLKNFSQIEQRYIGEQIPNIRNVKVYVYWGSTGVGKTYKAVMDNQDDYFKWTPKSYGTQWFGSYDGQKCLIIDDYDGHSIPYRTMLTLLDVYKLEIEIKGGHKWAQWEKVIITSNICPTKWYGNEYNIIDMKPLMRRLETGGIIEITETPKK